MLDGCVPVIKASELAPGTMRWAVVDRQSAGTPDWPGDTDLVPLDPTNRAPGSYAEWFQAVTGSTRVA